MRKKTIKDRLRGAARAQGELQKRLFHLKTLYDVSREIGSHIDSQQIIKSLLMMVMGVFGAVRGVIVLVDVDADRVAASAHRGIDAASMDLLRHAVETGHFRALKGLGGVQVLGGQAADDRPIFRVLSSLELDRWVSFEVNESCIGGIGLGEKLSGESYTSDDEELLATLCNQAAVAVKNATAHEKVVRYATELEQSLRRIQILESIRSNLAKFVPKTVQDLIAQSPEAPSFEKREHDVTVVFADITGYTQISAQLDLGTVNQLVERYFGAFLDEVLKHGGDVNETTGDGLMVIFEDPDPSEHARAAVRAALGIHRRTREINAQLRGQFEPITMHVGVNSGTASVGATRIEGMAGTRWTYTASGPTTNVAARLAALGEGEGVIISEDTMRRLGDEFSVEDLGPQALKNVAHAIRAYRLTAGAAEPLGASGVQERRRHARRLVSWPVRVWVGEKSFVGQARDASVSGLFISTVPIELLAPGGSYRIDILRADGEVACTAVVRYLADSGVGMETRERLPLN